MIGCLSNVQLPAGLRDLCLAAFDLILTVITLSGELFYVLLYLLLFLLIALFGILLLACLALQAQELLTLSF